MRVEDRIDATEILRGADSADLHFRFMGTAKNRQFVVNIQFGAADERGQDTLRPEEYDFMIGKVLRLILEHTGKTPNPALH
jgi:hypothetical protein